MAGQVHLAHAAFTHAPLDLVPLADQLADQAGSAPRVGGPERGAVA